MIDFYLDTMSYPQRWQELLNMIVELHLVDDCWCKYDGRWYTMSSREDILGIYENYKYIEPVIITSKLICILSHRGESIYRYLVYLTIGNGQICAEVFTGDPIPDVKVIPQSPIEMIALHKLIPQNTTTNNK